MRKEFCLRMVMALMYQVLLRGGCNRGKRKQFENKDFVLENTSCIHAMPNSHNALAHIMPSSRSGPGNESSKQGRWFNPKFIFAILCSFSSKYNPKKVFKVNFCQSDIPGAS